MPKTYHAYLGRKLVGSADTLEEIQVAAKQAVVHTGLNPWRNNHCGSVMLWDNISCTAIGVVTDDSNGVSVRLWGE